MKFPGIPEEESRLLNGVMNAVLRDIIANDVDVAPEVVAERFSQAVLRGERNFDRLKALTLGAEKAPDGLGSQLAN